MEENDILFNTLVLSANGRKAFNENELANITDFGISDIISFINSHGKIFHKIPQINAYCPVCETQNIDTETGFCGSCGKKFKYGEFGKYRIDINKSEIIDYSLKTLENILYKKGWKTNKIESKHISLTNGEYNLAILYTLDKCDLKDFYSLRGWLESTKNVCYIIFSPFFSSELIQFVNETPTTYNEISSNLYLVSGVEKLFKNIKNSLDTIKQENIFEERVKSIKGTFQKELDILQLQSELDKILSEIDDLALHNNLLSPQANGYKYQSSIIKLINLTILPIRVLAKQNIQDVLIRVQRNITDTGKQVRWIPLEIKSFKPKSKNNPYLPIKKYCSQIKKYIQGYRDVKVSTIADIECFSILAYDFELNNKNEILIKEIEKDFQNKIHISLFPQKSLEYMIKKKINNKAPIIDYDHIVNLFRENRYINIKQIEDLYKIINKDFKESGEETALKNVQNVVHKKGF